MTQRSKMWRRSRMFLRREVLLLRMMRWRVKKRELDGIRLRTYLLTTILIVTDRIQEKQPSTSGAVREDSRSWWIGAISCCLFWGFFTWHDPQITNCMHNEGSVSLLDLKCYFFLFSFLTLICKRILCLIAGLQVLGQVTRPVYYTTNKILLAFLCLNELGEHWVLIINVLLFCF